MPCTDAQTLHGCKCLPVQTLHCRVAWIGLDMQASLCTHLQQAPRGSEVSGVASCACCGNALQISIVTGLRSDASPGCSCDVQQPCLLLHAKNCRSMLLLVQLTGMHLLLTACLLRVLRYIACHVFRRDGAFASRKNNPTSDLHANSTCRCL